MGIFDFLKRKKSQTVSITPKPPEIASNESKSLSVQGLKIHDDLRDLIWIADGKYKNYEQSQDNNNSIDINGFRITISFMNEEEPSLIYTNQKINPTQRIEDIATPPYYPTYSGLTPEQKWVYLNLLANPYNPAIDIGFVFILYYGLERHLLLGNFEKAIDVLLKLRDVHTNKSFQSYSANAIILSCMYHKRGDLVVKFIQSLDKEYEFAFSDNLFLICYFSFGLPLLPRDILRMAKTFEFNNTNYIKKYPELFLECLKDAIAEKTGAESVDLKQYLSPTEIKGIRTQETRIFANVSLIDKSIPIPLLSENFKLKKEMYNFLEIAHESVKLRLSTMRKSGKQPIQKAPQKKSEKLIVFDPSKERELLTELSKVGNNPVNRHFLYIELQDFYYRYRALGEEYINRCIKYCVLDINSLSELHAAYIAEEILRLRQLSSYYGAEELNASINKVQQQGFIGNIPAFSRLAIIYEKQKAFQKAIEICDKAIECSQSVEEFKERKLKLQMKMGIQ